MCLRRSVAGAVKPDHQAVTDQLVGTYAGNTGDILQPLGLSVEGRRQQKRVKCEAFEIQRSHLEREQRAEEETVEPAWLTRIGKRTGARIGDACIGDTR